MVYIYYVQFFSTIIFSTKGHVLLFCMNNFDLIGHY